MARRPLRSLFLLILNQLDQASLAQARYALESMTLCAWTQIIFLRKSFFRLYQKYYLILTSETKILFFLLIEIKI